MDYILATGIFGSLVLVTGAAWPDKAKIHPVKSVKNWLFAIGGLIMLLFAVLGYLTGGPVFFVFLEVLVVVASVLMMMNVDDRIDTAVISVIGIGFIIWSLTLFEGYNTIFFILGLSGIGLGYAFDMGTLRRNVALVFGSVLIAIFSYIEASWVFFWLNTFFAIFSGYDQVQRALLWLKSDEQGSADTVIIYDIVDVASGAGDRPANLTLHFDVQPTISGRSADLTLPSPYGDQRVEVDVVYPTSATLSYGAPIGTPDAYPGTLYTNRLNIDPNEGANKRILTVLKASDSSSAQGAQPVGVSSANVRGTLVDNNLVLFPYTSMTSMSTGTSVTVATNQDLRVWWTGVVPGAMYSINATRSGDNLTLTLNSGGSLKADDGGMITATVNGTSVSSLY